MECEQLKHVWDCKKQLEVDFGMPTPGLEVKALYIA